MMLIIRLLLLTAGIGAFAMAAAITGPFAVGTTLRALSPFGVPDTQMALMGIGGLCILAFGL